MVEIQPVSDLCSQLVLFFGSLVQIIEQRGDGVVDTTELVGEEVVEVVVIFLTVNEGLIIGFGVAVYLLRNGDIFKQPVSGLEHGPVKQGTGSATVAIHKGVVIRQPEMQHNGSQYGVHVLAIGTIGKGTQGFQPLR